MRIAILSVMTCVCACGERPIRDTAFSDFTAASDTADTADTSMSTSDTTDSVTGESECLLTVQYVAPDPENQRPWALATHNDCNDASLSAAVALHILVNRSNNASSPPGLIPFGAEYPNAHTPTCVIIMWGTGSKVPTFILRTDVDIVSDIEVSEYTPGQHAGAIRTNDGWANDPTPPNPPTCDAFN